MKKWLLSLSIGFRLKLFVSILVTVIIVVLGFILYDYQKNIIFEQAKQNSYATINDLIHFTQNEIDASKDKIGYFGQAAENELNSLGSFRQDNKKTISYHTFIGYSDQDTIMQVPKIFRGKTCIQTDTTIYPVLAKTGIELFIYYQKVDDYLVEVLSSNNQQNLNNKITFMFPSNTDLWHMNDIQDSAYTFSYWLGNRWLQMVRLFTKDENNKVNGAIVVGIRERNEGKLGQTFLNKKFYKTGICYQLLGNGQVTFHPKLPNFYKSDNSAFKKIKSEQNDSIANYTTMTDSLGVKKYLFYKYYAPNYNNVVIEIPESEIFTSLYALRSGITIAVIVIVICVFLLINFLAKTITNRLDKAVDHAKSISKGDLTSVVQIDSRDELADLGNALNDMSQYLKDTVSGITKTVANVNETSAELINISKSIAEGANNQASSLEEISSSMEEMTSTVEQNTFNAKKTASISDESTKNIQNSSDVLHESVNYMTDIVDKISLINDISFQTNILALNAAVEAARAGEHGRGFSVVASEVRKLAERSKIAADQIGEVSNKGKEVAQKAGKDLSEHLPLVHQTADLVREITASSIEQGSGIEQINNAIQGLNGITQQNADEANRITSVIDILSDNSSALTKLISFFKIK